MSPELIVQRAMESHSAPDDTTLRLWLEATPAARLEHEMTLVVRIVDERESQMLNRDYRGKDKPTNVLSFPYEPLPGLPDDHLGDLIICVPVVEREALEQGKALDAHWAHMLVHGVLHLLGYDHQNEVEAQEMEPLEATILAQLGFPNPYEEMYIEEECIDE